MRNKSKHNAMARPISCIMVIIVLTLLNLSTAKSGDLKIIHENRAFYVIFPDSSKSYVVGEHSGGADNATALSPDSKYVFYTDGNETGFESSGRDLLYYEPKSNERIFLHQLSGFVQNVHWIIKNGHNYLIFLEIMAGYDKTTIDLFDFDERKMLLKMKGEGFEEIEYSDCFRLKDEQGTIKTDSMLCMDSLLAQSNPGKYNIESYKGWVYPNFLYLSIRKEPFLNPDYYWDNIQDYSPIDYRGLGICFPSHHKKWSIYCLNTDSKCWIGVLNNKTNLFQFSDSMTTGEYKYNFAWSNNDDLLGFVKKCPDNSQEIIVLEFLGDSSYTIRDQAKFKEEKDVEFIGWSILKGGFEYMIGEKELLKIQK